MSGIRGETGREQTEEELGDEGGYVVLGGRNVVRAEV